METNILNYRIIIEPDKRTGSNTSCYSAYCPTLGIADSGDTIEEALKNIKKGIEIWIESLIRDGETVPADRIEGSIITYTAVKTPSRSQLAIA